MVLAQTQSLQGSGEAAKIDFDYILEQINFVAMVLAQAQSLWLSGVYIYAY